MSTVEKEFEVRSMLNEDEFYEISSRIMHLEKDIYVITQLNQYFDTDDFKLSDAGVILRIRTVHGKGTFLTLKKKTKSEEECKEYTQTLSYNQHYNMVKHNVFPKGNAITALNRELQKLMIPLSDIHYQTSLKTKRIQANLDEVTNYCVDRNEYDNVVDYDIEVESTSKEEAKKLLEELAKKYNFEISKEYVVKSKRAINEKRNH